MVIRISILIYDLLLLYYTIKKQASDTDLK